MSIQFPFQYVRWSFYIAHPAIPLGACRMCKVHNAGSKYIWHLISLACCPRIQSFQTTRFLSFYVAIAIVCCPEYRGSVPFAVCCAQPAFIVHFFHRWNAWNRVIYCCFGSHLFRYKSHYYLTSCSLKNEFYFELGWKR